MVNQDTTAHSLCKVATSQSINSTSPLSCANMLCPHLVQSLPHRRRFKVRMFFAILECGTHGESPFQSPLSVPKKRNQAMHYSASIFAYAGHLPCSNQVTPLPHKSSTEKRNKRSATLKQDSRTHFLSLSSNRPTHTCGVLFMSTQTRCPLLGHSFLHEPKGKMRKFFAMLKSGTRGGSRP